MKTGLKFTKTKTLKNGPATIVIEEAEVDLNKIPAFGIARLIPFVDQMLQENFDIYNDGRLTIRGKGVSKCHEADEYDEKTGFYIAQSRATNDIIKQYEGFLRYLMNLIDKMFYAELNNLWANTIDMYYKVNDHIEFDLIKKNGE